MIITKRYLILNNVSQFKVLNIMKMEVLYFYKSEARVKLHQVGYHMEHG